MLRHEDQTAVFFIGAIARYIIGLPPAAVLGFFGGIVALIHWMVAKAELEPGCKGLPQALIPFFVSNVRICGQFALVGSAGSDQGFVRLCLYGDPGPQFLIFTSCESRRAWGWSAIAGGLARFGDGGINRRRAGDGN